MSNILNNEHKEYIQLKLDKISDIKKFVEIANTYNRDLYIIAGRSVVDAKSLMGVLSVDLENYFSLEFDEDIVSAICRDFGQWRT